MITMRLHANYKRGLHAKFCWQTAIFEDERIGSIGFTRSKCHRQYRECASEIDCAFHSGDWNRHDSANHRTFAGQAPGPARGGGEQAGRLWKYRHRGRCALARQWPDAFGDSEYPGDECIDRKSTRLNSSHLVISYAVFCLKKKKKISFDSPAYILHADTEIQTSVFACGLHQTLPT